LTIDKVKAFVVTLLALWFFGGPAYEPTSTVLRTASTMIQQFISTIFSTV
jgi:hypothetical protein